MHGESPEDFRDEVSPEDAEEIDRLSREYIRHVSRQIGHVARRKPIEEVTGEFRDILSWLQVEGVDSADDREIGKSDEIYLDYSAIDIEDTYFIVYGHIGSRRNVRVEDIIREHEETNLSDWQKTQTKEAAEFLVVHGANENEVYQWKGVDGTARQQRALRRMYWLLSEPYMQKFTDFLRKRATTGKPFNFRYLAFNVKDIVSEGLAHNQSQLQSGHSLVPRRKEELEETHRWLSLALNVCEHVFDKDIEDGVY